MKVSVIALALFCALAVTSTAHADTLYALEFGRGQLYTVDPSNGTTSLVGSTGIPGTFGLTDYDGRLFTYDQDSRRIVELDPATAAQIAEFDVGFDLDVLGEGALAFRNDGTGFLVKTSNLQSWLYTFDIDAGTSSLIGTTDIGLDGLDFDGYDVLHGLQQRFTLSTGADIYTIDTATASAALLGESGLFDTNSLAGLTFREDGSLWGEVAGRLVTFDPLTAAPTDIGALGLDNFSGLTWSTSPNAIPEPGTFALALFVFGLACWVRRRRT